MLSYQWQDKTFRIASLNDRRPIQADDELIVIACPDPPGADDCRRVVSQVRTRQPLANVYQWLFYHV